MSPRPSRRATSMLITLLAAAVAAIPAAAAAAPKQSLPQSVPACPGPAAPGDARCHARVRTDVHGKASAAALPWGYAPGDLLSAYSLPAGLGTGQTVAVVDAYDDPLAESDLAAYRAQFGLPACTTANGCFRKVNETGKQGSYPRSNSNWAMETSLDLDMVSAICPNCHILLVEARSTNMSDFATSVNTAAKLGAVAISNSYGANEWSGETNLEAFYNHPGVAITASSGDSGYGVEYPAASRYVTAVGGTSLQRASTTRGWSESAWSGGGSGCSAYIGKPSWQVDAGCPRRTIVDVAAVADPNPGVAVYDSYNQGGWLVFGGTSVGAPIVAAIYAAAANTSIISDASYTYGHASALFDITTGAVGTCGSYLCTAGPGYDGPTGLGTPNGTSAF